MDNILQIKYNLNTMIDKILINNGFADKEAAVYLSVLEAGESPISNIAKKTQLKRSTVYHIVDSLQLKGVVSVNTRRGIQYISALSPRILIDRFKKSAQMAERVLPELMEMAYSSTLKPRIRFFEGLEGIKQILREFSYSKIQSMGFTDYEPMPKDLFKFIRDEIVPERIKNKNCAQLIVPSNSMNQRVQSEDEKYFTQHRIVNFPMPENPIELLLFGEMSVAFLSFVKKEMFAVVIDSPAVYNTIKNIFLFIWNLSENQSSKSNR